LRYFFDFCKLNFCAFNLRKYTISVPGQHPKNILQSQFIDNYIEEQYKDIMEQVNLMVSGYNLEVPNFLIGKLFVIIC